MDLMLALVVLVLTCIILLPLLKSRGETKRIARYIDQLPGDKWYPVIGTAWNAIRTDRESYFDLLKTRHKKYGPFVRSWLGGMPVVNIYKPEHAQVIFRSNTILSKGVFYRFLYPWLGQGLISGSGPKWKVHRKIITPSFHFSVLDVYGETFSEKAQEFSNYLRKFAGKGYFEVTEHLVRLGLDIIAETAMGAQLKLLREENKESLEYAQAIVDFCTSVHKRIYNPFLANDTIFSMTAIGKKSQKSLEIIHKFNQRVIQTRKAYFDKHKEDLLETDELGRKQKRSFLDMLLAHQETNHFGDDEIEEEVNTFMFGGQDTTVGTMTFAFMALGNHPEVLKRVQEELDAIFADDPRRKVTNQDIAQMEYLDMVIKEVLRCYCFVPYLARKLEEDVEIDGKLLPKGTTAIIGLYELHHDPDHYPDPYKFDPDRFLPENAAGRHPYAFCPFSAGPRNCLGQKFAMRNIKTQLTYILREYNVTCQEKPDEMKYYFEIVLRPQHGLHIALEPRC